jgi:Domain of unknown function (DUF6484)
MKKLSTCAELADTVVRGTSKQAPSPSTDTMRRNRECGGLQLPSVLVGRVVAVRNGSEPLIDFPANVSGELVCARSLVSVSEADTGREVVLVFEDGDSSKPIIVGLVRTAEHSAAPRPEIKLDEETLVLIAKKEIVLRCGKSSITLTSAGKVLLRGAYLLSRSSGVNRIKGGSVQIN